MNTDYDLIISGGGMVGAMLACALGQTDLNIALLEGTPLERIQPGAELDYRVSAINRASQRIFAAVGAWESMVGWRVSPFRAMPVSYTHLDVYKRQGEDWRVFEPGMVTTVEPGLYLPAGGQVIDAHWARLGVRLETELAERWQRIGVRIEDDVLVTADGNEVLSAAAPKEVAEIEALMREGR